MKKYAAMKTNSYDKWAKVYDLVTEKFNPGDLDFYKKEAKGKILEIACGTGRIYLELLKENPDVYGIDISRAMLKVLRRKATQLRLKTKVYGGFQYQPLKSHKQEMVWIIQR